MKKIIFVTLFFLISVLSSCEKSIDSFLGKNADENLIGTWTRTYSTRDINNSISFFTDTIEFRSDNNGHQRIFVFDEPWNSFSFQYYTQDSVIYMRPSGTMDSPPRIYSIDNDSLTLMGGIPYIKLN